MTTPIALQPALRRADIRSGVRIEIVTIAWMTVEAVVATTAGIVAHSVLLTAFGIDSVIELVSGGTLLWRLSIESRGRSVGRVQQAENRAAWIAGIGLVALSGYIVVTSALSLWLHNHPEGSSVGMGLAMVAVVLMPVLTWQKRRIADRIDSGALRADAACSLSCAYMAASLLVGLGLNTIFGWWWADALAAISLLYWIIPEAREALTGARAGRGACGCDSSTCES
jgi:divalent metal cation (Fe/Co/Zn/Cd) transporter